MIRGIGTDICEISRIGKVFEKQGQRLAKRILTPFEIENQFHVLSKQQAVTFLAKRFAVKEAIAKALGTGIGTRLSFQDIDIGHDSLGKPLAKFSQRAIARFDNPLTVHISLSDEQDYVVAFAVWEV